MFKRLQWIVYSRAPGPAGAREDKWGERSSRVCCDPPHHLPLHRAPRGFRAPFLPLQLLQEPCHQLKRETGAEEKALWGGRASV